MQTHWNDNYDKLPRYKFAVRVHQAMKKVWSFYDQQTGVFTGRRYSSRNQSDLAKNIPAGCGAADGSFDHLSKRVDIETGAVVDWQPPRPDADHEWHAETSRWVKRSDVLETEARRRAALSKIAELEQKQFRIERELRLRPAEVGTDGKTPAQRLEDLDADIARMRSLLSDETETTARVSRQS
jgi:hypothetical protein